MSRLLKDSAVTFVAEMAMTGVALLNSVLTFRVLGAEGRGTYFIAFSFASLAMLLLGYRWERPVGYFLGKDKANLPTALGSCLVMTAVAPALAWLLWLLAPSLINDVLLNNATRTEICLALGMVAMVSLWQTISCIYAGLREFLSRSIFMICSACCLLLPVATLAALGFRGREALPYYLAGHLCVSCTLYVVWIAFQLARGRWRLGFDWSLFKQMFVYSSATYLSVLLNMAAIRFDQFLLNWLSNGEQVGVYSVALSIVNTLLIVPTILSTVLFARVAADEAGGGESTARLLRITGMFMSAAGVVLIAGSWLLLKPVFGREAGPALLPMLIMAPATITLGLVRILGSYLDGRGKAFATSACSLLAGATVVSLDLFLIPRMGVMGLALGALIGQSLALAVAAMIFCRAADLSLVRAFVPRREDVAMVRDVVMRVLRRGGATGTTVATNQGAATP